LTRPGQLPQSSLAKGRRSLHLESREDSVPEAPSLYDTFPLEREVRRLKVEAQRLATALATTDEKPEAIVAAIAAREKRMQTVQARVEALRTSPAVIGSELSVLEKERATGWTICGRFLGATPSRQGRPLGHCWMGR